MTAKRFEINNDMNLDGNVETYELSCLVDNDNKTFYFIVDSIANVESFVERLNELNEENTMLKEQRHEDINELSVIAMKFKALEKENEQLKAQLLYDGDGVCNICKYHCLVKTEKYYVAKCEKEHAEASKVDLQYCEDFELVEDYK